MLTRRPEAEQDLVDIYLHVSRDNPPAADKLVRAIDAISPYCAAPAGL
jgi:plasmid stabilization system protein ParE